MLPLTEHRKTAWTRCGGCRLALAEGDARHAATQLRALAPELEQGVPHYYRGRALEALDDLKGAQRAYARAQQRSPTAPEPVPEPVLALLRVAKKPSDFAGQRDAARQLLRFREHRAAGFRRLVEARLERDDLEQAEEVARPFVEQDPEVVDAHVLLARVLRRQERMDEAEQVLAEAESRLRPSPEITAERASLLAARGPNPPDG